MLEDNLFVLIKIIYFIDNIYFSWYGTSGRIYEKKPIIYFHRKLEFKLFHYNWLLPPPSPSPFSAASEPEPSKEGGGTPHLYE